METFWSTKIFFGEFIGSFILALGILLVNFASKAKSFKLESPLNQKIFIAIGVFASIMIGAMTAKGLGGHGQINPGITLIVATIEKEFQQVPLLICFQLLGGIFSYIIMQLILYSSGRLHESKKIYNWSNQSGIKTSGIEILGNAFWFLPIAAMYIGLTKTKKLDFFQLIMIASLAKTLLILSISELGVGNFNPMVWLATLLTTITAQGKITNKQLINELMGTTTSLLMGLAAGGIGLFAITL